MLFSFFNKTPKAFNEGYVSVGSGHELHFAEYGNPSGEVIIRFHGGPGGSFRVNQTESYDLKKYRVILFSQRGCGQSKYTDLLKDNTPYEAVSDAEKILTYLKIPMKNLIVSGASYGATLALLFAEKYPNAVKAILVNSVFLAREVDLKWTEETSACFYPDLMHEMKTILKPNEPLLEGYARLINTGNYEKMKLALKYYGSYERCLGKTNASFKDLTSLNDNQIKSFKISLDYERHQMFLKENEILDNIQKIAHIPTLIVHNRLDMVCPINQAWELSRSLKKCTFIIVPDIGHGSDQLYKEMRRQTALFLKKHVQ